MKPPTDSTSRERVPNSAIGFTAVLNGSQEAVAKVQQIAKRAIAHFDDLHLLTITVGRTSLTLWGRGELEECLHSLPDGSLLVLIGSPTGAFTWGEIVEQIQGDPGGKDFILPWEGRVILLKIDPQNNAWTLWNDWIGSIPVFHTTTETKRIASTLEPAVVELNHFTSGDVFLPGLTALLIWGHYISDWTLFKEMKVVPPDCEAIWDDSGFCYEQFLTVKPSDSRWQVGWDDLVDEMYELSRKAIANAMGEGDQWVIPLSSGLDSRLIAGVAAELGKDVRAYTWGLPHTSDVIHARSIARALDIPWKHFNPGNAYLASYRNLWADLFGSAMHFHGMYQMPFMDTLDAEAAPGPILSGFLGDCLAGYATKFLCEVHTGENPYQLSPDGYLHWKIDELPVLMKGPVDDQIEVLSLELSRQQELIPGAIFQQLGYLILWGRQRFFTYFQSMMSDYWRGVATPFLDRNYARFSFSLPRAVFDERILQRAMLSRYYPKLAVVPGTYAAEPALLNGSYFIKKRITRYLPESLSRTIFPGLYRIKGSTDVQCVVRDGKKSFYPLFEKMDLLSNWVNVEAIENSYSKILAEKSGQDIRKLQCLQTLAYRMPE